MSGPAPRIVNAKARPGPRSATCQERTAARVAQNREALMRLKRSGGDSAVRQQLLVYIAEEQAVMAASAGRGVGEEGMRSGGSGGGGAGAGGAGAGSAWASSFAGGAPSYASAYAEDAGGAAECYDGLTLEEEQELLLRLQQLFREEEEKQASAEQLEHEEADYNAELEYLVAGEAAEDRGLSPAMAEDS
jgi:hypothetical protein